MVITAEHLVEVAERPPLRSPGELGHAARRGAARPAGGVPLGHADDGAARRRWSSWRSGWRRTWSLPTPRSPSPRRCATRWSTSRASPRCTPRRRRRGRRGRGCARTSRTSSRARCARIGIPARYVSGYLHPDSDAPRRHDGARRLARVGRVVGGRVVRVRRDQPRRSPATTTSSSRAGGPTTTSRRCGASTPVRARRPRRSRCRSRARPESSRASGAGRGRRRARRASPSTVRRSSAGVVRPHSSSARASAGPVTVADGRPVDPPSEPGRVGVVGDERDRRGQRLHATHPLLPRLHDGDHLVDGVRPEPRSDAQAQPARGAQVPQVHERLVGLAAVPERRRAVLDERPGHARRARAR